MHQDELIYEDGQTGMSVLLLCAFALSDCTIQIESRSAKYLRAVHRTALELAVPNLYGSEIGGFWLKPDQVEQLRRLPDCYPANEVEQVKLAVEAYLLAQTAELKRFQERNSGVAISENGSRTERGSAGS